jgi:hypothetical protein
MGSEASGQVAVSPIHTFSRALLESLCNTKCPKARFILRAALIVCIPAVVVAIIGELIGFHSLSSIPSEPWPIVSMHLRLAVTLLDIVVVAPFIETGLCFLPIIILRRFGLSRTWIAVISGVAWGATHLYMGTLVQVASIWAFFCFTLMLQAFEVESRDGAWVRVSIVHGLANAFVLLFSVPFWR